MRAKGLAPHGCLEANLICNTPPVVLRNAPLETRGLNSECQADFRVSCVPVSDDRPGSRRILGHLSRPLEKARKRSETSLEWLGDLDSNQGCPGQSREFYR